MQDNANSNDKNANNLGKHRLVSRQATPGVSGPRKESVNTPSRLSRSLREAKKTQASGRNGRKMERLLTVPVRYLSASVAIILSVLMLIANLAFHNRVPVAVVVVIAIVVLANGWSDLVQAPERYTSAITILLVGGLTTVAVVLTDDFAWATIGLGMVVMIGAIMEMSRPQPRANLLQSLSASVFGGFVAVLGVAWMTLAGSPLWSVIMSIATVAIVLAVIGNQIGSTLKSNSIWAIVLGTLGSIATAALTIWLGGPGSILDMAFPSRLAGFSNVATAFLIAGLMGLGIGAVVALMDTLFGEHNRRISEAGAFARGAAKFLTAIMPIYVIVRVGALF